LNLGHNTRRMSIPELRIGVSIRRGSQASASWQSPDVVERPGQSKSKGVETMPVTLPRLPDREESADLAQVIHITRNVQGSIAIEEYHVEDGRYIRDRLRTHKEVIEELGAAMNRFFEEYGFSKSLVDEGRACPASEDIAYIACYAVTGSSEGDYVHVGFVLRSKGVDDLARYVDLCFGKTFRGKDYADALAALAGRLMGA